jgi:hypothetical protein
VTVFRRRRMMISFFYFSGHGDTFPEPIIQDGKTIQTRRGFLVAYNEATNDPRNWTLAQLKERNIELTLLASNIIQMPARHRLIFLDSCFSGLAYMDRPVEENHLDDFNTEVIEHPSIQIMTAGLGLEEALEDRDEPHGIYTAALLKQLTNDNILNMEEIFVPLRTAVRTRLNRRPGNPIMTPQLRSLIYTNGAFLFVPQDQLQNWASVKSDSDTLADAEKKGFLRPVTAAEATNVQSMATNSADERENKVEHYETRAAMGDPYATIALAQIYNGAAGMAADTNRARIYTAESSDYIAAGSTLNIAALAGLNNEVLQKIVGNLFKENHLDNVFRIPGAGIINYPNSVLAQTGATKPGSSVFNGIGNAVGNAGNTVVKWLSKDDPIKDLVSDQEKAKKSLTRLMANHTSKNKINARKELVSCQNDLTKLEAQWQPNQQPPEFVNLKNLVSEALTDLDQDHPDLARPAIDEVQPFIEALQRLKSQSGGKRP